ncbi:uncharacterized protein PHACADRAFT_248351 [Phanerochaete carnosa HHB-10118-sp]|uniref:Uncharacterized protein n=1 Tax=Phanerochaete carnosa (strain HHB-10118-sp) TaxID=650164 RepID=K5WQU8_PHACS|nr:uncharacterized protein PHACADRAFT_248351 [Phanerochaete carnosa HHB-10118-sp]EKM61634.1 hypothetical protein PHACADRAFT_248351 [Phanerochaete carnosa HHB-10118-sp]
MAPHIKFTSFGIPYLANITFRRKKRSSKSVYSNAEFSDSDWTFASASSDTLAYPAIDKSHIEEQGLYVCFAAYADLPPRPLSPTRAMRLKHRIASAVVRAGMGYAGDAEAADPIDCALRERGALPPVPVSTLYTGTYGQVWDAFEAAGLVARTCDEAGFPNGRTSFCLSHWCGGSPSQPHD